MKVLDPSKKSRWPHTDCFPHKPKPPQGSDRQKPGPGLPKPPHEPEPPIHGPHKPKPGKPPYIDCFPDGFPNNGPHFPRPPGEATPPYIDCFPDGFPNNIPSFPFPNSHDHVHLSPDCKGAGHRANPELMAGLLDNFSV